MTDSEIVDFLAKHFIVKNARMPGAYGSLELWWAAADINADAKVLNNPHMQLGAATNSYSLAAMGELKGVIDAARANAAARGVLDAQPG